MGLSSFYSDNINNQVLFALTTLHPDRCSIANGLLTADSVSATIPDSFEGHAQRAASVFVSQPVDWFFFPPTKSFELVTAAHTKLKVVGPFRAKKLILTLYVDMPGANAGTLKNSNTAEETPIKSLTEYEYEIDREYFLSLSGVDENGATVNILIRSSNP